MRARATGAIVAAVACSGAVVAALGSPAIQAHTFRIVPGRGKITVNVQTDGQVSEDQGAVGPGRTADRTPVLIDGKYPAPHSFGSTPGRSGYDSRPSSPVRGLTLEARDYRGQIVYDPLHPMSLRVELHVPVRSLEPIAPSLEGSDRSQVVDWVRSTWILDVGRAPEISFIGSGVHYKGAAGGGYVNVQVPGRLEVHHRMNPVRLTAMVKLTNEGVEVIGRYMVDLRSFDIIPLRDRTGTDRLKRDVEVDFHITAVPQTEDVLDDDEAHPATFTPRAEHAGELSGAVPEVAPLKIPEIAPLKVPEEAILRIPEEAELRGRAWVPDEPSLLPRHDPAPDAPVPGASPSPAAPK